MYSIQSDKLQCSIRDFMEALMLDGFAEIIHNSQPTTIQFTPHVTITPQLRAEILAELS